MSTTTATRAPWEPSAWLRDAISKRHKQIRTIHTNRPGDLVVAPLGPKTAHGAREDRTCDRCRTYVPPGPLFYVHAFPAAPALVLIVGLCRDCHQLERVDA